jgi:hypothetical protein
MKGERRGERGMALLLAIVFALVMSLTVLALGDLVVSELAGAAAVDRGTVAFAIADGALERAREVLSLDPDWSDQQGATRYMDPSGSSFAPLYDPFQPGGGGAAVAQPFPAASPIGTYTIEIRRAQSQPQDTIWVRTLGAYQGASRSIEALLHRLSPSDFAAYSAATYAPLKGGGGNVTINGSAYFYSDLILKAVKTGVYNDRAINVGDLPPYLNQLYVRGTLDMSTGNPSVGTASQPMYGVHAGHINASKNLYTLILDNVVPAISYPDVAGYIACLASGQCPAGVTVSPPGNALVGSPPTQMIICQQQGSSWTPVVTQNLVFGSAAFFVPTAAAAGQGGAQACAQGPVSGAAMLVWTPSAPPGSPNLVLTTAMSQYPILVPGTVSATRPIVYSGVGTIVVEDLPWVQSGTGTPYGLDTSKGGQILSSSPASGTGDVLGCGYTQPGSMPSPDLLAVIVQTSAILQGSSTPCRQEQDLALVVGRYQAGASPPTVDSLTSSFNVQLFGMAIASQLDTTQNPDFWQVPGLWSSLPAPVLQLESFTGGQPQPVVIEKWHELTPLQ